MSLQLDLIRQPTADEVQVRPQSNSTDAEHAVSIFQTNTNLNVDLRSFSSWYRNETSTQWLDPAKQAFDAAKKVFAKDLSPRDCDIIWLQEKNSMIDVQQALVEARVKYEDGSRKSKTRRLLASCSSRVIYYAPIFDTLSQHYPEYVSLAWGAFKFFFTAMLNHEELLAEFATAITNIADALPRTKLLCELYPVKEIQDGVANVYAKIIKFVLETVSWYNKTKLQHAITSIINPYKLSFKAIVDEIAEESRRVDELANTAVKAEIRDVHLKVGTLHEENLILRSEMLGLKKELLQMHHQFRIMSQTLIESRMLQNQMAINQQGQNSLLLEQHTESLRQALESSGAGYGDADKMLAFGRLIRNRRRLRTPTQLPRSEMVKLGNWAKSQQSCMLIAQANGIRSSSIDFAVDFLDVIIEAQAPTIWALPLGFHDTPTIISILQALVLQTLSLSSGSFGAALQSISTQDLRRTSTASQWFSLLERCFQRFQSLFVIVDVGLIQRACSHDDTENGITDTSQFIERLRSMMVARAQGGLKIVFVSFPFNGLGEDFSDKSDHILQIYTDRGVVQERKLWNPKMRGTARRQMRMSQNQFRVIVKLPINN